MLKNEEKKALTAKKASLNESALLNFLACGSVDDGKSTLIGRILFECGAIYDNELEKIKKDSINRDCQIDFSLMMDGLSSEREQGITIDVAYRYFSYQNKKYVVIDSPGHEQYTRNMATGASQCDLALILIDARKKVLKQTKRHSYIASILGIKNIIVVINKMDLVNYQQKDFEAIKYDYLDFAEKLNFNHVSFIPVSALKGDNVITPSNNMPWYDGLSLMDKINNIEITKQNKEDVFIMPVQWVNRPNQDFRGYSGQIISGEIKSGQTIYLSKNKQKTIVKEIFDYDTKKQLAKKNDAVTLTLEDEIDISRGEVITSLDSEVKMSSLFQATLLWMSENPLIASREYVIQLSTNEAIASISQLKYQIDIHDLSHKATKNLSLNQFGKVEICLNTELPIMPYQENKKLGGFILVDRMTNETTACGFIDFSLRRNDNLHCFNFKINQQKRSQIKNHQPFVIWLTGISGAGKSTIADIVETKLNQSGIHTSALDGDNIRQGLNKDLGFSEQARVENIRRVAEVARLMFNSGLITIVSFISPFASEREMAKKLIGNENFMEIFVNVSLETAIKRDPKGLYQKAQNGEIKNFTGFDSPYQKPKEPALTINSDEIAAIDAANQIIQILKDKGIIN